MLRRVGRSTISILLVDDNRANLRVTEALLEANGCNVTALRNGIEAVSACRDTKFDLILVDCQMPEMDGYEATRRIREFEAVKTTPIVALTETRQRRAQHQLADKCSIEVVGQIRTGR